jgi:hypothetical protein
MTRVLSVFAVEGVVLANNKRRMLVPSAECGRDGHRGDLLVAEPGEVCPEYVAGSTLAIWARVVQIAFPEFGVR